MRDDFTMNQVVSLTCVYLSPTEHYQLDCFIGQYKNTRNLQTVHNINNLLSSTLESYPGNPPVMVNELNAWLDKTLGYRAAHPEFLLDDA
ncbi:hypothetical protein [Pseudomonas sp. PD9R]|uniref:hypothetical protein n=1 Tax=Pseudomonas sp. PD9R TaxID=2853534 RepID=UPI001C4690AF|nr:hypothetical protein [Pseudomonas sp. PD9R]MBV6824547.1 hypothetical protein [Pseudomonas sp. PD9R]